MKFVIAVLVVAYIAVGASFISKASTPPAEAPEEVAATADIPSVVRLHDMDGNFFCSGTIVSDRHLITAAHCVYTLSSLDTVEVRDLHNRRTGIYARVAGISERADYAILKGRFSKFQHMKALTDPRMLLSGMNNNKRQIIACGFAWSGDLFCTTVTNRHQMNFQIAGDGYLYPGMSGGPVIDVATGALIGVNSNVQGPLIAFSPIIEIYKNCHVQPE